jgi:hypothetical protein
VCSKVEKIRLGRDEFISLRVDLVDIHELIRSGEGQGFENNRPDDAEDCGCGADPRARCQYGEEREHRAAPHLAGGESEILKQLIYSKTARHREPVAPRRQRGKANDEAQNLPAIPRVFGSRRFVPPQLVQLAKSILDPFCLVAPHHATQDARPKGWWLR